MDSNCGIFVIFLVFQLFGNACGQHMSQPQPMGSGGSGMFNFNPGTGHASEISALQSGLSGSAVDMTSFLPPPFDGPPAPVQNQPPTSSLPATPVDNSNVASSPMDPPASIPNNMRTDSNLFSGPSVNSNMNSVDQSSMFSNMPANFNAPSITNEIGPPMPSLKQDSMFGPSEVSANTQGVDTTNYNVLDMNQTSTLDIAINRGNVGSNPFSSPFSNPNNPSIVNAPRDTGVINEHSVFEESMFNAPMPTDTGLLTDTANTGTATTDASSVSMFDMEMNMGVGTSSGNAVNPPVNVANSPTNTQFNEFNRMDMAGPHSSRFGVVGSRFGSLNVPNNIGRSSNQHIQDAIRHNAVPPPPTMGEPGISTQNTAVTSNSPVATVNDTHVNDLNSEGIYPFEGNMNAMDASFSEAKSAITDMNRVLIGHEPLHLEPTGVPQSSSTNQAIDPAMNNPDMVGSSSISGFGSGPITNLVGVVPGKANSGGMAVSDFNSQMHEFSTLADNTGSISNPTMSTFDIGAGQPDATVISQENIAPINELASLNVGGTALGSQSFDFGRISLPDTAFVSDKTNTNVPTQPEVNRPLKVDMSNFLPPPFMTEELGGPSNVIPDITMGTDQFNQNAPTFHQNAINSPSKEALPEPSQPPAVHQPTVQSRPMSMLADEFRSISEVNPGHHAQPVVGSIFGTTDMTNSTVLTKKLLEKSGMTRKPDVDFMTSFLSSAKPSRTLNRGNENLQIVPFGSDMHNIGTQSNNMNIVGRSEANSVDQFGVADIYTRQQQLNPSQWKQFMAKVAQDATTAHAQNQSPFNYQTQNLIGASETKPLTGNLPRSNVGTTTRNSPPSLQAFIRPVTGTTSTNGEFTMFAAPGMSGHKSVTIPNFMPGSVNQQPSFLVPEKQPASTATTGNVGPQQRNEFVSSQPTALRTNPAASSNTFNQRRPDQPNNLVGRGGADTLQGSSIANSAGQFTAGNNQANVQSQQGQLGQVGGQTPGDMNTFSLGQSILISDGTVPEFARPSGNMGGTHVPPGASPNFQTLGQPAIRSNVDTVNTQQTQRFQPGGQSVMSQFNNQGSPSFPQMDANPNMPISFPSSGVPTVSRSSDFAIDANMGMRPMVPGMPQSGQAGQATSVDPTQASGVGTNAAKQPMSPTLFTSGNRLAVFGPANDVSGRQLVSRQIKPVPAMRVGVLAPVLNCRYSPDPSSEYYFIYKNGLTQHRFRCALGTAFDAMTCECSIRVSDHGDCLEVHMDFNEGVVVDSSLNRLPIGNENVEITNNSSPIPGIALFGGDSKLTIWRYQNYDFRDHVMLKVQFRAGVGGQRYQPLISNCDGSVDGPSLAIVYDNLMQEVQLILQTDNDTRKQLTFSVNPDEWNDVTYIYDGQEFIGIVNGVRRYVSKENPHLLGLIGGVIKSAPTQGLVEIRDAAIVLGHCPKYGFFRGAMVDIQIYTCIPKDFRLE